MLLSRFAGTLSVGLMALGAAAVSGQDYPNKPIRIVTSGVGGGSDFIARQIAQGISDPLRQPVIVDNRNATIAAETVSKAPPDGYTLVVTGGSLWITPLLQKAPYDAVRDFSPIALIVREVNVVVVHSSVQANSIKELIALAKAKPGQINYASSGTGSSQHLAGEMLKAMAGINIVHVPYKGSGLAITGVIAGEVQLISSSAASVAPHIKSGRLRVLAVTSAQPSSLHPGLPTVASSGLPGFEVSNWNGLLAAGVPPKAIINRLNQEIVRALKTSEMRERLLNAGVEPVGSSPEEFAALMKSEIARMGKIIKDAGIRAD